MEAKDKAFYQKRLIRFDSQLRFLDEPLVMGILNINPDSFYDGGQFTSVQAAVNQALKMQSEGADIIDLGPASSKPGSALINHVDEWKLLQPIIEALVKVMPEMTISLDTYNSLTAEKAFKAGVSMINDISGGLIDPRMIDFIGESQCPYVIMHMQGIPENMQTKPNYDNVVKEVALFFSQQLEKLAKAGASDIILDPGFGFGKSLEHNYQLFNKINYFKQIFDAPLLVGVSRKSMIYKALDLSPTAALNGTTVLHTLAVGQGANILRVHDVREAVEVCKILKLGQNYM